MAKRTITVVVIFLLLFLLTYGTHSYFNKAQMPFSLLGVYTFHVLSAIIAYVTVEIVASKLPNQAGYAYLMLIFFKIGAFLLIFQSSVFLENDLPISHRIALIIPLFIFLIAEAIAVSKLLNSQ